MKTNRTILLVAGLLTIACVSASAQQITGVPGSPESTTTITGRQLPPPDPKFGGVIKEKASRVDTMVAAARRAAETCAQRVAHYDG